MANFKRKRCKRIVRCTLCTLNRWKGNAKDRRPAKEPKKLTPKQVCMRAWDELAKKASKDRREDEG